MNALSSSKKQFLRLFIKRFVCLYKQYRKQTQNLVKEVIINTFYLKLQLLMLI